MDEMLDLFESARKLSQTSDPSIVLDTLETHLRQYGASHLLITGLPMPNRPIDHLILRMQWPDYRRDDAELTTVSPSDSLLSACLTAHHPFVWHPGPGDGNHSELLDAADTARRDVAILLVPVEEIDPFQASLICAGTNMTIEAEQTAGLSMLATAAFHRLIDLGAVSTDRPGDLSARERRILELTAGGKTAADIADLLRISQRTVHAHLQNAGSKLNASNKTHTVVEALRYAQIRL